jgi:hypothetical protein
MKRLLVFAGIMVLAIGAAFPAGAEDAGQFTELEGRVTVTKTTGQSIQATLGSQVRQGDVVSTERDSKATILFQNGSVVRLSPSTTLTINQLVYDKDKGVAKSAYDLASGAIMNIVGSLFGRDESEFKVNTPTSVAGVRGSINIVQYAFNPATGGYTTTAVGLQGTTFLRGRNDREGCVLPPGTYGRVDDLTGQCQFLGKIPDDELQDLLGSFEPDSASINQRAGGLRNLSGSNLSITGDRWYSLPDLLEPMGGGINDFDNDPEDQLPTRDDPFNFVTVESPLFTDLIINIIIP